MANKIVNSKPGPNGSRLLYDEKGRYLGRSVKNAAGNQVFLDSKGNYAGRCKPGPGNHTILVPESGAKENDHTSSHRSIPASSVSPSGYWGFAVVSLIFLIIGGLGAACLYYDLRWGLDVGFLEVAGFLLGILTIAADLLILSDYFKKKRLRKNNRSPADPSS